MDAQSDGMRMIRSQLCQAVNRLQAESRYLTDADVTRRMREIERIAREHELIPLARIAKSGLHTMHGPGHRHALACHLERMEDAAGCNAPGEDAIAAIMASIAVRLA